MGPPHNPEAAKSSLSYYYEKDAFNFQELIPNNGANLPARAGTWEDKNISSFRFS
jgi:hypothetical protein